MGQLKLVSRRRNIWREKLCVVKCMICGASKLVDRKQKWKVVLLCVVGIPSSRKSYGLAPLASSATLLKHMLPLLLLANVLSTDFGSRTQFIVSGVGQPHNGIIYVGIQLPIVECVYIAILLLFGKSDVSRAATSMVSLMDRSWFQSAVNVNSCVLRVIFPKLCQIHSEPSQTSDVI